MDFTIRYSDSELVICEKPSGMLSQADEKGEKGLRELLCEQLGREVFLIHRLDRPVSGLMVFALDAKTAARLSADIADHSRFIKEYLVCVGGRLSDDAATLRDFLFRDRFSGKTFAVSTPRKGAKEAILEYRLLSTVADGSGADRSFLRVRLHTGRTHQIRAQFSSRGNPVAGDGKYGSRIKGEGIALHSYRLAFEHPKSGKTVDITSFPAGVRFFDILDKDLLNE